MMPFVGPPDPGQHADLALAAHLERQAAQENRDRNIGLGWQVGPAAANLFDAWATQDALKRGGTEANPVMAPFADNPAAMYGIKLGTGILAGIAARKLAKAGHPNLGRIVGGINIAVPLGLGAHNLAGGRR
jgi:hypothetical protein